MTDWWARLTRGRAVSRDAHVAAVSRAFEVGRTVEREQAGIAARLQRYATPDVPASDNLTGAAGMAVWDDDAGAETA